MLNPPYYDIDPETGEYVKIESLWIEEAILKHKGLSSTEKLMCSLIDGLTTPDKGCFCVNRYLGRIVGIRPRCADAIIYRLSKEEILLTLGHTWRTYYRCIHPKWSAHPDRSRKLIQKFGYEL